mmetsp:Transcript_12112/g.50715  ORF Transcript_12112/g.50715 Transcript_12112/m.50715 type:complete len:310 (+) Transcript_12112:888-1817(+)
MTRRESSGASDAFAAKIARCSRQRGSNPRASSRLNAFSSFERSADDPGTAPGSSACSKSSAAPAKTSAKVRIGEPSAVVARAARAATSLWNAAPMRLARSDACAHRPARAKTSSASPRRPERSRRSLSASAHALAALSPAPSSATSSSRGARGKEDSKGTSDIAPVSANGNAPGPKGETQVSASSPSRSARTSALAVLFSPTGSAPVFSLIARKTPHSRAAPSFPAGFLVSAAFFAFLVSQTIPSANRARLETLGLRLMSGGNVSFSLSFSRPRPTSASRYEAPGPFASLGAAPGTPARRSSDREWTCT